MTRFRRSPLAVLLVSLSASLTAGLASGQELFPGVDVPARAPARAASAEDETESPLVRFAAEIPALDELLLVQEQPTAPAAEEAPVERVATRRGGRTYRLPSMFGDFYGGGALQVLTLDTFPTVNAALPIGGAVRRTKIAENNIAVPRDRLIFNYNFFNDVGMNIGDVNRYTFGIEKTFLDGTGSIELRLPMASTLDTTQFSGGPPATDTQVGDLAVLLKAVLLDRENFLASAGLGITAPLAEDSRIFAPTFSGPPAAVIGMQHESVHLLPYLAFVHSNDSGWYMQGFVQLDIDANGNPLAADAFGGMLQPFGVYQDQTLLFVDLGIGRWVHGDPNDGGTAVAVTAEVHYATTLQDADVVGSQQGVTVTSVDNRFDVVNLTVGAIFVLNNRVSIRPGMVIPLHDDQFDYEAMVQANILR